MRSGGATDEGGRKQLEHVDARAVAHRDLVRPRTDQARDPGSHPVGQAHPVLAALGRPLTDELPAPLLLDDVRDPGGDVARERAETVAVEVDHAVSGSTNFSRVCANGFAASSRRIRSRTGSVTGVLSLVRAGCVAVCP